MLPALGAGIALQNPATPFLTFILLAMLSGVGGGAFASAQSRVLINRDGVSFWLDVSLQLVSARLSSEDGRRPLAADPATRERLFRARQSAYRQAHVRLDAEHATTDELVERIVDRFERRPAS